MDRRDVIHSSGSGSGHVGSKIQFIGGVVCCSRIVLVVVGKLPVLAVVVRPAAVASVVVVRSGRAAAIRPEYPYPLAQTKYEL